MINLVSGNALYFIHKEIVPIRYWGPVVFSMSSNPDLKGSSFTLSVLHIRWSSQCSLSFLQEKVDQAPTFLLPHLVVINISKVAGDIDFVKLKMVSLKRVWFRLASLAVLTNVCKTSRGSWLAVMTASKSPSQAPAKMAPIKVVRTPIRSGQQVYAKMAT